MAYATKTRGFRLITVAGVRCRWRASVGEWDTLVTLQSACTKGAQQAQALVPDYTSSWLAFPELVSQFLVVTPALARRIIEQALALGWQPELRAAPLRFTVPADFIRTT